MFLFHPIHFLKFLLKSQPQSSYKKGVTTDGDCTSTASSVGKPMVFNSGFGSAINL